MTQNTFHSKWYIVVIGMLLLFVIGCQEATVDVDDTPAINTRLSCSTVKDCVPDSCCHARGAVNKAYAPDCAGMMCTMNCEPGTLDCGQGEIRCVNSQCIAVISE